MDSSSQVTSGRYIRVVAACYIRVNNVNALLEGGNAILWNRPEAFRFFLVLRPREFELCRTLNKLNSGSTVLKVVRGGSNSRGLQTITSEYIRE